MMCTYRVVILASVSAIGLALLSGIFGYSLAPNAHKNTVTSDMMLFHDVAIIEIQNDYVDFRNSTVHSISVVSKDTTTNSHLLSLLLKNVAVDSNVATAVSGKIDVTSISGKKVEIIILDSRYLAIKDAKYGAIKYYLYDGYNINSYLYSLCNDNSTSKNEAIDAKLVSRNYR